MRLRQLLAREDIADAEITGIAIDSRSVKPGDLFVALRGSSADGRAYVEDALTRGAVAVLGEDLPASPAAIQIATSTARADVAAAAARFFGQRPRWRAAVTGTNGKTSTVDLLRQIEARLGRRAASIGTLGVIFEGERSDTGMTTPDVVAFHRTLAELAQRGAESVAYEASSHALDQYRVDGVSVKAAGFSNLTRDHLDYHGSMEAYFAAKARILDLLADNGTAVINVDDLHGARLAEMATERGIVCTRVGASATGLKIIRRSILLQGQRLLIDHQGRRHDIILPLVGGFQADNALLAAAMAIALDHSPDSVFEALTHVQPVPGRIELATTTPEGAAVYVDYAHTPDGLRAALQALRPHTRERLIVMFGCGGDRDRGKRPMMASVAGELADQVIITDDNPRTEDAAAIREEVRAGFPAAQMVGDRRQAIAAALAMAGPGDVVLLAGKGHEQGQIIGSTVHPFNDVAIARALVAEQAA